MCHHNDRPISPRGSAACYKEDNRVISPRVSAIRPHSPGEEALGPMSPRHVQEPAFSCVNESFSSAATPRREPQPRTTSLGTSMGSSIETSTAGAQFTDTQPRTASMGTSMGSSMETSTGEQETPQFFTGAPLMALRGDTTTWALKSDDIMQPHHRTQAESHQDVVSRPHQRDADPRDLPISPALRSRDLARDPRDLVRPISPALRSPALSCPVPRPPTTITSSSLTSAGCNEGNFYMKIVPKVVSCCWYR